MPVQIVITGDTADMAQQELVRFAAPMVQAQFIAGKLSGMRPAAGSEGVQPAAASGDGGGTTEPSPSPAEEVMPEDDPHYGKGANNPAARELNAEAAEKKRRGRQPKGTVAEKGAVPTNSEDILPKFKVIFDDHEEHFDALGEAFERMQDFVEAAADAATIDTFMTHNKAWIEALDEKHGKMLKALAQTIIDAKAALSKPATANDDAPAKIDYTVEHARAALRALAADRDNELLNDDQKREAFLRMKLSERKVTKISELTEGDRDTYIAAIVQVLSPAALAGLKQKWAEIK